MDTQDEKDTSFVEPTSLIEPVDSEVSKIKYGDVKSPYSRDTENIKTVYFSSILEELDREKVSVYKPISKRNVYVFVAIIGIVALLTFAIVATVLQRRSSNAERLCQESKNIFPMHAVSVLNSTVVIKLTQHEFGGKISVSEYMDQLPAGDYEIWFHKLGDLSKGCDSVGDPYKLITTLSEDNKNEVWSVENGNLAEVIGRSIVFKENTENILLCGVVGFA